MNDGIIEIDKAPASWGFTRDRFRDDSYLWKDGSTIIVSLIVAAAPGHGHFSALVRAIEADGYSVGVPSPLGKMVQILRRWGFVEKEMHDDSAGEDFGLWVRPAKPA